MQTNFRAAFAGLVRGIPATIALILVNVGVWLLIALTDTAGASADANGGQAALLTRWGANIAGLTFAGEPWRLFTSMFLHAGLLHLAFNSLALLEIGGVVERRIGAWRTLAIYLLAGLGGACASASWHDFTVSVGASGAIFGLLAAVIACGYLSRRRLRGPYGDAVSPGRALFFGVLTLALGAFLDFDNAAHLGGFTVGMALALALLLAERVGHTARAQIAFVATLLAVAIGIAAWTASAFDPAAASRLRFAQSMELVRIGNSAGQAATLRRCAMVAAAPQPSTPADALVRCLGEALAKGAAASSGNESAIGSSVDSAVDITNRYAAVLEQNRQRVWPQCRQRTDQLMALDLSAAQRQIAGAIGRYCQARARLEAAVLPDAGSKALDAASLQEDLVRLELLTALADDDLPLPLQQGANRIELLREANELRRWRASLTRDDIELARLSDCPFALCRRGGAR